MRDGLLDASLEDGTNWGVRNVLMPQTQCEEVHSTPLRWE
jgi:hypothetical protein